MDHSIVFGYFARNGQIDGQYSTKIVSQTIILRIFAMNDEILLNERIEVITVFGEGLNPCRPIRFRRPSGREVEIKEIGLRHPSVQGKRMIHVFDVTDGGADYRLEFDSERLTWHLTREADHYE
jgi:hypothetical protein